MGPDQWTHTVNFHVHSTQDPVLPPVTVEASYAVDSGRVRFREALVNTRYSEVQQRRRRQPRPD